MFIFMAVWCVFLPKSLLVALIDVLIYVVQCPFRPMSESATCFLATRSPNRVLTPLKRTSRESAFRKVGSDFHNHAIRSPPFNTADARLCVGHNLHQWLIMLSSSCDLDRHIVVLSSCDSTETVSSWCYHHLVILWLPNEDFECWRKPEPESVLDAAWLSNVRWVFSTNISTMRSPNQVPTPLLTPLKSASLRRIERLNKFDRQILILSSCYVYVESLSTDK